MKAFCLIFLLKKATTTENLIKGKEINGLIHEYRLMIIKTSWHHNEISKKLVFSVIIFV